MPAPYRVSPWATSSYDLLSNFESIELLVAPTAESGIETALQRRPDLIIMDINLPGMSGIDALRALRVRYADGREKAYCRASKEPASAWGFKRT